MFPRQDAAVLDILRLGCMVSITADQPEAPQYLTCDALLYRRERPIPA